LQSLLYDQAAGHGLGPRNRSEGRRRTRRPHRRHLGTRTRRGVSRHAAGGVVNTEYGETVMGRILVVDDHDSLRRGLVRALANAGHDVEEAANGTAAIERLQDSQFDVVLTDLRMGGADGMDVLRTTRSVQPSAAVILMTAFGSIHTAVEAMKIGAFDFV